ncbi:MAG: MFS transporter, partial [Gemmatimonadota bacterium]
PADLSWVAHSYTLLFGGFLLLGGRVGDLVGRRRTFILGVLAFTAASLAGALAQGPVWLVVARAAQGLAAALVAPSALSLLLLAFREERERNHALGVWGAVAATGGAAGGLIGGILTQSLGWAAVLYVNVPIGLAVAWLAPRILPAGEPSDEAGGFDLAGALTVTGGIGLGIYALVDASDAGWGSIQTLGLLALAVVLLAAFAAIERRTPRPLVPPGIFGDRSYSAANAVAVLVTTAMFPTFFILTLYLQQVLGLPPLGAGLAFLPISLSLMVATLNGPRLAARFGTRPTLVAAMGVAAAGLAWFGFLSPDGSVLTDVFGPSVLTGVGAGVAWTASARAATARAGPQDAGLRSGVLIASQQVGGAVGLGVVVAVAVAIAGPAADRDADDGRVEDEHELGRGQEGQDQARRRRCRMGPHVSHLRSRPHPSVPGQAQGASDPSAAAARRPR